MKVEQFKIIFILFFCVSANYFFEPYLFPSNLLYFTYFGFFALTLVFILANLRQLSGNLFIVPIFLISIGQLISGFSATLFWGQGLFDSIKALIPSLVYITYFLLVVWGVTIKGIEKLILVLGFIFIIVFLITFILYPTPSFGNTEKFTSERGFQRVMIKGVGFLFLFHFFALNGMIIKKSKYWLLIFIITSICIVLTLTRTYIAFAFFFSLVFVLRNVSLTKKVLTLTAAAACIYFVSQMDFFDQLSNQTKEQSENIVEDVRVRAVKFYLMDFPPNTFTRIFGNGEAFYKGGRYTDIINYLEGEMGLYASDIGYIGFYTKYGILPILAYIYLLYCILRMRLPEKYLYAQYFMYFIFTISIIIDAPFNTGFVLPILFALYVLSVAKYAMNIYVVTESNTTKQLKHAQTSHSYSGL